MSAVDMAVRSALNLMVAQLAAPVPAFAPGRRVAEIIGEVAFQTGVRRADILGPSRRYEHFRPRAAAVWLAMELRCGSVPMIGRAFGGRDHSSIYNARRRAKELRQSDPAFRCLTDRLLQHFRDLEED
ncbi:helix-turn-helix domain-containing protein [Sphingobium ummariense]|uniref:Chromosomal replication initiator DnaA C-terminal domain-containing protein n=1 Tax=Sphingobium ummariense RL-3 TaxID=1346791 RepID=T0J5A5_9SPHN|nr:helix-turn-helix domain-containing protein [Sphingobium ummariense]EQB32022.1 hypothetical protein M529_11800 [Sphingobium ummariense RL-3]